jgi:hypothetical protein
MTHARRPRLRRRVRGLGLGLVAGLVVAVLPAAGCSSKPKADATAFCDHYAAATRVAGALQQLDAVAVADIQRQVRAADEEVQAAVRVAPDEVKRSSTDLGQALHRFRLDVDKATTNAEVASAAQRYRTEAATLVAAQAQLNSWTTAHCGLVPDAPSTTAAAN